MTSSRKSLIFDLDGTLWDATGCAPAIWNRIFDKHDEVKFSMTQELAASLMGKTMEEIGETLFPDFSEEKRRKIVDEFGDEEATRFAGIPFVWAKYGFGKALSPDAVLNDIRELPALLSSLL